MDSSVCGRLSSSLAEGSLGPPCPFPKWVGESLTPAGLAWTLK